MGEAGSEQAAFEKATWPQLFKLANERPESGIAFQSMPAIPFCVQKDRAISDSYILRVLYTHPYRGPGEGRLTICLK